MTLKHFLILFLINFSLNAYGQIKITDAERASNHNIGKADVTSPTVWGGLAGPVCGSLSATSTCNNCGPDNQTCNEARIHDGLLLRLSFTVTGDITGPLKVGIGTSTTTLSNISSSYFSPNAGSYSKDSNGTVEIQWSAICNGISAGGFTCEGRSETSKIFLYIDSGASVTDANSGNVTVVVTAPLATGAADTTGGTIDCTIPDPAPASGICTFHAYPGDEKITMRDLEPLNGYPNNELVRFTKLRVLASEISFADANYGTGSFTDLTIPDGEDEPEPAVVGGLTNGVTYFFRSVMIDEANNQAFLQNIATVDASGAGCAGGTDATCDMIATPLEVYGLLPEDLNCFISTAAYGSSMSKEVQVFREFRNRFMVGTFEGEQLIKAYYNYGAKFSHKIYNHPTARLMSRVALTPALWFAKSSLKFGLVKTSIGFSGVGLLLLSAFAGLIIWGRRRWQFRRG